MAKFCRHCGQELLESVTTCPKCGGNVEENSQPNIVINNNIDPSKKEVKKWTAFLLCFFLGGLGAHKFYEGKIGMGILYILTLGLFGIGVLVDLITILTKPDPYYV